jgi:hypothetical protein
MYEIMNGSCSVNSFNMTLYCAWQLVGLCLHYCRVRVHSKHRFNKYEKVLTGCDLKGLKQRCRSISHYS